MKTYNLTSAATGREVANQIVTVMDNKDVLFTSYGTAIAKISKGTVYLDEDHWDYSRTTMKYLAVFLNTNVPAIRAKVELGAYELDNLN